MSFWISPTVTQLRDVIRSSNGHLLLCSPFISSPALNIVAESLPVSVTAVEVWTRLEPRDWLTGISDPEGLLDFMQQIKCKVGAVPVRQASNLHAKIIVSNGPTALAGSANLTMGGFERNMEASRIVSGAEITELRTLVGQMRPRLQPVSQDQFEIFVSQCTDKLDSQEALLDLIRQEMPPPDFAPGVLIPYQEFLDFLKNDTSTIANQVLDIARNRDGNNNTGKVKQAFFGVQRFLNQYPQHREFVASLPADERFEVQHSPLMEDWRQFLEDFADEINEAYKYSIPTLRSYLTPASGGNRTGGGGGDNQLKRVWPLIGRIVASHP